ncbi:Protein LURP-one-related 15, partial [Mucuna pruriens]
MAYPNYPYPPQSVPSASVPMPAVPTAVIGPQYCAPYPLDLAVVKKVMTISDGNFVVTDANGNIVFKIKGSLLTLRDRRVLVGAAGNPIVTLRRKIMTAHDRWQAFRGESTDPKDLIFSLKRSSLIQLKTKLDVFLAHNTKEDVCDFKVKGSWFERSCAVYAGESDNIVAQMHKKHTVKSVLIGKDHFMVTVYPNTDYAFIVALIVILDEINEDEKADD